MVTETTERLGLIRVHHPKRVQLNMANRNKVLELELVLLLVKDPALANLKPSQDLRLDTELLVVLAQVTNQPLITFSVLLLQPPNKRFNNNHNLPL
jgi:hypothetical protein